MASGIAGKFGFGCLCIIVGIPLVLCLIKSTNDEFRVLMSKQNAYENSSREKSRKEAAAKNAAGQEDAERVRVAAAKERIESERRAASEAERKAELAREDRLRSFVLRESPELWRTYQDLGAQIEMQGRRIGELRATLETFDKKPEEDADFCQIELMRKSMNEVRLSLRRKMEDAYLAFRKFEATPNRKDYDELRRKTIEDGVMEAEAARRHFDVLRKEKP